MASIITKWIHRHSAFLLQIPGPAVLIGKILLRGEVIYWGTAYMQFLPWRYGAWEMIIKGIFPLWNPQNGMGAPLLANYQTAFFYPPNLLIWLGAMLDGLTGIAFVQTLLVMLHLILGGIGMVLLTRSLGMSKTAQTISGIVFGMTSYAVARASFLSMNAAIAWIPFQLWTSYNFICEISRDDTRDEKKLLIFHTIFLILQLLSGHAQITWYTQILITLWIGLWLLQKKSKKFFRRALPLGFSMMSAVLICAVQLIPTAEYLLQSQRADAVTFDYAVNYSFWGWRILTLFSPNLFGNPGSGTYWVSADNYWEDAIYYGFLPILLTLVVVIINLKASRLINSNTRKTIYFFSGTAVIGFIFALGKNTAIFPFFYHYIPTFDLFQAPTRFNLYLAVSGAVLTGYGFDHWKKPVGRWLYWSRLGAMAGAGAVVTSLVAKIIFVGRIQETYLSGAIETSILFLVAVLLNLTFAENGTRKWLWQAAVILAVLADLLYAGWFSNPGIKITQENLEKQAGWYPFGNSRVWLPTADESILKFNKFFRFDSFHLPLKGDHLLDVFLPNTNLFFGKYAINNYDPFVPSRFSRFQSDILETLELSKPDPLAFLNIGMVQRTDLAGGKLYHFAIEGAQRYHFINCADFSINEEESLSKTKNLFMNDEFLEKVIIDGGMEPTSTDCRNSESNFSFQVMEDRPNYQKLITNTDISGWLMQMDTWYPGWKVKIDGISSELLRTDYLFRGVKIPPGEHMIEFIYQPGSFIAGLIISILGLFAFLMWIICNFHWRKHYE